MIDWCLINVCSWSNAIMTLFLQGELLGRLPRSLPHALQLGHRGADFQQSLNWNLHFLSHYMSQWSVITILMTRSTATWVWMTTDAGWATTACPSSLVDVLPLQVLWLWRRIWKGHWEGQQRWNWYRQQAWIGDESQKMGQGDIFFPLSKSRSDFEMTNKINNDKLKRKLICETPHQNFATSRLWQRLRQRC